MNTDNKYLRLYPIYWPVFSTKKYVKDQDGWWNPNRIKRIKKNFIPYI